MGYSKSEIRKAIEGIEKELNTIKNYVPGIRIVDVGINWMNRMVVGRALGKLNEELAPLKDYIIDNDDYTLAKKLNDLITPVWSDYCTRANKGDFDEIHKEAYPVQAIITDLRKWIGEYEAEHPKRQDTPTNSPSGENEGSRSNYIVNIEVLNVLPSLYAFLVKKEVINGNKISCTDYTTAIEKADISSIYPYSVKYKFKTTIKAIQKCFTEDWFKAICKSAGISEDSMGKSNLQDTAKQQWFKELDKIVADL